MTHGEGVRLLPGDGGSPGAGSHLVGEGLGDDQHDEADVRQGDERGQQHHQVVSVAGRQVGSDGRAGHQAGCKGSRHLVERGQVDTLQGWRTEGQR